MCVRHRRSPKKPLYTSLLNEVATEHSTYDMTLTNILDSGGI